MIARDFKSQFHGRLHGAQTLIVWREACRNLALERKKSIHPSSTVWIQIEQKLAFFSKSADQRDEFDHRLLRFVFIFLKLKRARFQAYLRPNLDHRRIIKMFQKRKFHRIDPVPFFFYFLEKTSLWINFNSKIAIYGTNFSQRQ